MDSRPEPVAGPPPAATDVRRDRALAQEGRRVALARRSPSASLPVLAGDDAAGRAGGRRRGRASPALLAVSAVCPTALPLQLSLSRNGEKTPPSSPLPEERATATVAARWEQTSGGAAGPPQSPAAPDDTSPRQRGHPTAADAELLPEERAATAVRQEQTSGAAGPPLSSPVTATAADGGGRDEGHLRCCAAFLAKLWPAHALGAEESARWAD